MTAEERDALVVQALQSREGRAKLWMAMQAGAAKAADHFPEGSMGEAMGRYIAGLPFKPKRK